MYILIRHTYIAYEPDTTTNILASTTKDKLIAHVNKLEGSIVEFTDFQDGSGNLSATLVKPGFDHFGYTIEAIEVL